MAFSFQLCIMSAAIILVMTSLGGSALPDFELRYGYTTEYTMIWSDKKSGADEDVSIWRPVINSALLNKIYLNEQVLFPLGDVVVASHSKPGQSALVVGNRNRPDTEAQPPKSYTEIWNDRGSGADKDVRILRLNPPSGFTCLGDIAVQGYSTSPDLNKYRCVNSTYLLNSRSYRSIWTDEGSGAKSDVAMYRIKSNSDASLDANTFTAISNYHTAPSHTPVVRVSKAIHFPNVFGSIK